MMVTASDDSGVVGAVGATRPALLEGPEMRALGRVSG